MSKPELEDLIWNDDKKFVLQYDKNTGELYVSNRKVAYDVRLTFWQAFFAIGASIAVMIQAFFSVMSYFNC